MKKKLIALMAQKKTLLEQMQTANDADDLEAYNAARDKMDAVVAKIERTQELIALEESNAGEPPTHTGDDEDDDDGDGTLAEPTARTNSRACVHAFAECIRAQARGDRSRFDTNAAIVRRAVRVENAMTEGVPADGGLIVPQDIQMTINELRRDLQPLADLFNVETVSFLSGSRVVDKNPKAGFTKISEMTTIPQDDQPSFAKIGYQVEEYGLIVPVSNDLLADTDEALLAYLARWFAKKGVLTENKILLALLSALDTTATAAAAGKELATIKTQLNKALDPAISKSAHFVTNQDGYNLLDLLEDKNGRPLLQPNPSDATSKLLFGRAISVVSTSILPSAASTAPVYFGDFEQYGTLFRRKALELAATDIGGKAWNTNSTEVRGIMRLDAKTFDTEAATAVTLSLA